MTEIAIPLTVAFALGFAVQQIRLPPLVGYLVAGFALHAVGFEPDPAIDTIADLGVLLLLFGIGLKLKLSALARPVVWVGTSIHLLGSTVVFGLLLAGLGLAIQARRGRIPSAAKSDPARPGLEEDRVDRLVALERDRLIGVVTEVGARERRQEILAEAAGPSWAKAPPPDEKK